jgi:gamma-glutamylcyclotransferase (GGCT)/AIG2-like uncharacterized protein YtfP
MIRHLFAYGTLQHGHAPREMTAVVAQLRAVGRGTVPGALYDLGHYPGAILSPDSQQRIHGTIFALPADPQFLRNLDEYEECDPAAPAASQFLRAACVAELDSGVLVECWIYVYNRPVAAATRIEGGRWRR